MAERRLPRRDDGWGRPAAAGPDGPLASSTQTPATGPGALTDAQRRAALAAAAGLSNRRVAELLGTSERTVENHLRTAFRKLGVKRRQELEPLLGARSRPSATAAPPDHLTPREGEVARLVGRGMSDKMVARLLRISVRTVESHVAQVRSKLGFTSRGQIIGWTYRQPSPAETCDPRTGVGERGTYVEVLGEPEYREP